LYGVNVALVSNAGGGTVTSTLAGIYIAPISTNPTVGCSNYGLLIGSVTANSSVPARNYAIQTSDGLVVFNQGGNANSDFRVEGDTDAWLLFTDASADFVGIGLSAPGSKLHVLLNDDATNAVTNVVTIGHDTTSTAAAGFGAGLEFDLESSTTAAQSAARVQALWYEATHASRKADLVLTAYDTSEREGLRIRGAGSAPAIGFLGATPQARIAHVADPSGGATVDAEARSAINSILSTLELFGFHAAS
jgi:hypothetical protein